MSATHSLQLVSSSSQYASIADASCPNLEILGSQTWECWFKPESFPSSTGTQRLMGKVDNLFSNPHAINYDTNNTIRFELSGLSTNTNISTNTTFDTSIWNHIGAVYDGSNLKIYVNGELENSAPASGSAVDTNNNFAIGRAGEYVGQYYDGLIRNVRIWNVARTQAQIRADMNVDTPSDTTGLQGNWVLNNAYTDSSGNGYDLTASGSPVFSTTYPDAIDLVENGTFTSKHKITIDNTKVSGSSDLTDAPIVLTEDNFLADAFDNSQGQEIYTNSLFSDSSLKAYYRFESGAETTDSSGNSHTLTEVGSPTYSTGKFGQGIVLNGSSQKVTTSGTNIFTTGSQSFSIWAKIDTISATNSYLLNITDGTSVLGVRQANAAGSTGFLDIALSMSGTSGTDQVSCYYLGVWNHIVCIFDTATGKKTIYVNGVKFLDSAYTGSVTNQTSSTLHVGSNGTTLYTDGTLDEVAIFHKALSQAEVEMLYKGGVDLRFSTDVDGKERLAHEIVSWDTSASTGEVWVKANTLSYNADTDIYVHYNNSSATALDENEAFGKHQVWGDDWEGVWHLTGVTDSTKNSVDLTETNTPTTTTGKLGGGYDFVSASSQYLTNTTPTALRFSGDKTMILWINPDAIGVNSYPIGLWNSSPNNYYQINLDTSSNAVSQVGGAGSKTNTTVLSNGTWYFLAQVLTAGTSLKMIVDSSVQTNSSISAELAQNAGGFSIGRTGDYTSGYFDGQIDNVMIYNGALSDDFITTLYNNQNSPSTFATPSAIASDSSAFFMFL